MQQIGVAGCVCVGFRDVRFRVHGQRLRKGSGDAVMRVIIGQAPEVGLS